MLADQLDYLVGVDPHRDTHALAIVDVRTAGVVFEGALRPAALAMPAPWSSRGATRRGGGHSRSKERVRSAPASAAS